MSQENQTELDKLLEQAISDVKIDSLNLSKDMASFPSTLLFWSLKVNKALGTVKRAEGALEQAEAHSAQSIRASVKVTEAAVKEKVTLRCKAAREELREAERQLDIFRRIESAVAKKENMLINVGKAQVRNSKAGLSV